MSFTLVDVAGASFRTDEASDELNTEFMRRLGMKKRYLPARLAISRSLSVSSPPTVSLPETDWGKVIKGDTLFGTGVSLSTWVALIVQHHGTPIPDLRTLVNVVASHWKRGLDLLDLDWKQSGEDLPKFVRRLVEQAELSNVARATVKQKGTPIAVAISDKEISVPIGEISEEVSSGTQAFWTLNGPGCSPHSAIMGGVGSGKTRTAVSILKSIREQAHVPIIAFDFKGDLATDDAGGGYHLETLFGATVVDPPRTPVPLDVLSLTSREQFEIAEAASRFRESFCRLKGSKLGDKQRDAVFEAAHRVLSTKNPCELPHFLEALLTVYSEREMKEDGAISAAREICRFPLFSPDLSPAEFFQQSWIIKLPPNVVEESRSIVVNLILDALDQYLNSLPDAPISSDGSRGLRLIGVIDEAHRVLGSRLPALSSLIRMSRSKGGAIMLISQSPDDFSGEEDDFLSEMGLVAAFSTNAPARNAGRILGKGANLAALSTGQCFVKRRGDQAARRIQSWR